MSRSLKTGLFLLLFSAALSAHMLGIDIDMSANSALTVSPTPVTNFGDDGGAATFNFGTPAFFETQSTVEDHHSEFTPSRSGGGDPVTSSTDPVAEPGSILLLSGGLGMMVFRILPRRRPRTV
jgi:hypothetical protein